MPHEPHRFCHQRSRVCGGAALPCGTRCAIVGARPLGVDSTASPRRPHGEGCRLVPQSDRRLRAGAPRSRRDSAGRFRLTRTAPAAHYVRHRRLATDTGGRGTIRPIRNPQSATRNRAGGRPATRVAALRRALGSPLARRRALRREQRVRARRGAARRLALPRLRRAFLQQQQAVRPLRAGTTGGR